MAVMCTRDLIVRVRETARDRCPGLACSHRSWRPIWRPMALFLPHSSRESAAKDSRQRSGGASSDRRGGCGAASRSKGATGRARWRADFQGLGPTLVRGERPHESRVGGTGAKRVPGRETTKIPARNRPRVDPSHGERDTTTCVERRRARERGAKKGEGLLKFLIWGSRQKAKTGQEKASSRYGARTHDFFACGGHRKRRPELAMKLPVALTVPLPTSPPHNDRFCSLL